MAQTNKICATLLLLLFALRATQTQNLTTITIEWSQEIRTSKTTPSLQVVVNPPLRRNATIHDRAFEALANLSAEYVRYVPWFPYPRLAVAELEPPTRNDTSWDFELIDPMLIDFMNAQNGRKVVINFSTIPQWMFNTTDRVPYPDDPNQVTWDYQLGKQLRDPTLKEISDYYQRVVNWYVNGGFTDELGCRHVSGHNFTFDYWEVLNEVEVEHKTTVEQYTERYDAIVSAIHSASPHTKFVGMALIHPEFEINTWFPYFLNHSNHANGIVPDMISYHVYTVSKPNDTLESMQTLLFQKADNFVRAVKEIETVRAELSPNTRTYINEIGTMYADEKLHAIPDEYWNLSGAVYAYIFAHLSLIGIDIAGESQLVGYPTQFPSVSLVDWETGEPNARYRVLQLIIDNMGDGIKLLHTSTDNSDVYALGFMTEQNEKKLLVINKVVDQIEVVLSEKVGVVSTVDVRTKNQIESQCINSRNITLRGYSVQILAF